MGMRRASVGLGCLLMGMLASGGCFDFGSSFGQAIGKGIATGVVCASVGRLQDADGDVRDRGTESAEYLVRNGEAQTPLMLGTEGRVRFVGISIPDQPTPEGSGEVVRIEGLLPPAENECWAAGNISALAVGTSEVRVTGGKQELRAALEVAAPARFELATEKGSFEPGDVIELGVGEQLRLEFVVRDARSRELAFLSPLVWMTPAPPNNISLAGANEPPAGIEEASLTASDITIVAERPGRTWLSLDLTTHTLDFSIVVRGDLTNVPDGSIIPDPGAFDAGSVDAGVDASVSDASPPNEP